MVAPINIRDTLNSRGARVTKFGQLVVAPLDYSTAIEVQLTGDQGTPTVENLVGPSEGQSIVITDVMVFGGKDVTQDIPAQVQIYEASSATTETIDKIIFTPQVVRGSNIVATSLNLLIPGGVWINVQVADFPVFVTLMFYRVPAENL